MVSSGLPGRSQTLTLLVNARYTDAHNVPAAYAAATVLMGIAVAALVLMRFVNRRGSRP